MALYDQLSETAEAIRARGGPTPLVGVILGSGLGDFADALQGGISIRFDELPHFPLASVPGHPGRLILGQLGGTGVAAFQGRVHAYEGYAPWQVAYPARVLCLLGIRALLVTNAAGGIRPDFAPGDWMAIADHLNFSGFNALTGTHDERLGPRFVDLSRAYDPLLLALLHGSARRAGLSLRQGVYAMLHGPSYETPAEIRALRALGADAVGMSTVPEVVAAVQMGARVAGLSCISNLAAGVGQRPLSHQEVAETARRVRDPFRRLLEEFLPAAARLVSSPTAS